MKPKKLLKEIALMTNLTIVIPMILQVVTEEHKFVNMFSKSCCLNGSFSF